MSRVDRAWLTRLLTEWARYVESLEGLGHADATTLWRAQFGTGSGNFQSSLPQGLERLNASGELLECCRAIDRLKQHQDPEIREPIRAMMAFYLFGRVKAAEIMDIGASTIYREVQSGERLLRLVLRP